MNTLEKNEARGGDQLQEVTNAMVALYKELFGRGPTKARSDYAGPDTLITTLQNSLTLAEKNMVALNEHQRLREVRMFFQHASDESSSAWLRGSPVGR